MTSEVEYKGFTIAVTVAYPGSSAVGRLYTQYAATASSCMRGSCRTSFADETAAEDAAYAEAREWIDAKCQLN